MPSFLDTVYILGKADSLSLTVRKPEEAGIKLTMPLLRKFSPIFSKSPKLNNC